MSFVPIIKIEFQLVQIARLIDRYAGHAYGVIGIPVGIIDLKLQGASAPVRCAGAFKSAFTAEGLNEKPSLSAALDVLGNT